MDASHAVLQTYLGISAQSQEDRVLRLLIELGAQFAGAQEGSLLVFDQGRGDLVFAMTVGDAASQQALAGQRVPIGKGVVGLAAQIREVQIGAPTFGTPQAAGHQADGGPRSVLAAPMLVDDRLIGVLTAVSFLPDKRFTSGDGLLYARLAAVAGVVVDQGRRLAAVAELQSGGLPPESLDQDARDDRRIVEAVSRLVRARPEAKAQVARLLLELAGLLAD
jgi:GAF domain-containing protein